MIHSQITRNILFFVIQRFVCINALLCLPLLCQLMPKEDNFMQYSLLAINNKWLCREQKKESFTVHNYDSAVFSIIFQPSLDTGNLSSIQKIFSSDILLQIDKKEFLASGDVIYYMNWLPTGQIYNIYVSKQIYMLHMKLVCDQKLPKVG